MRTNRIPEHKPRFNFVCVCVHTDSWTSWCRSLVSTSSLSSCPWTWRSTWTPSRLASTWTPCWSRYVLTGWPQSAVSDASSWLFASPCRVFPRATFTRSWRESTSATVAGFSTGTWNPRTYWSTTRAWSNWRTLAWPGPLAYRSGSIPTRWDASSELDPLCLSEGFSLIVNCVLPGRDPLVSGSRGPAGLPQILHPCGCLEHRNNLRWARHQEAAFPRRLWDRPALQDLQVIQQGNWTNKLELSDTLILLIHSVFIFLRI